jgi:hypothetical protein
METATRTRVTEPKLYRVTGPAGAEHFVKALTKAGAVGAVASLIVSEPLTPVEVMELGITSSRVIDATTDPVRYPLPRALGVDVGTGDAPNGPTAYQLYGVDHAAPAEG